MHAVIGLDDEPATRVRCDDPGAGRQRDRTGHGRRIRKVLEGIAGGTTITVVLRKPIIERPELRGPDRQS
ncbi:hypothetical protein QNA29_28450 [Rhodococcus opacus]|nr:hypothetical protein [Rhodococcus opacus]MDJ0418316.1 hypothetical protein [Rhodococcus opacus]